MIPTCKQVTEILSEDLDQPVTGLRRFKLKLHLAICRYCRRYGAQMNLACKTVNLLTERTESHTEIDDSLRQALLDEFRHLHQQSHQHPPKGPDRED